MRPLAKPALLLLLSSILALSALGIPQAKSTKTPAAKRRTVRVEDPQQALLAQAEEAIEKKDFLRAVDVLKKYLVEQPGDALAHVQLGYAYVGLEKAAEAKAEFERAIELDAKLAPAHLNLGVLLLESDPAASVVALRRAAELQPQVAHTYFLLGTALERSGKRQEAIEQYRAAVRLDQTNLGFRLALGQALLAAHRAAEAETELRVALELKPDHAPARLALAESLIAQKQTQAGARELAAYLEKNPEDKQERARLASLLAGLGRPDEALAELDRAEAGGESSLDGLKLRGEIYTRQNKIAEAVATLEKAVQKAPRDAELHARLGRLWLEKREFPAAERELLEALRLDPKLTDPVRDLVAVYYLGEKYEAALRVQDELARRESPAAGWWFIRATCYDRIHKLPEAIAAYEKFLALDEGRSDKQDFQARQRIRILKRELERNK